MVPQSEAAYKVIHDSRVAESHSAEVSLIIPVYNVAPYLEECLAGVFAMTATVRLEIIIIDDGSTDGSGQRVSDLLAKHLPAGVLYARQHNQGLSAVRNLGVSLASGNYIGFLDSDDLMSVGAMRCMLDFARENDCDVMLGRSVVFDSKSDSVTPFYDEWVWSRLWATRPAGSSPDTRSPLCFSWSQMPIIGWFAVISLSGMGCIIRWGSYLRIRPSTTRCWRCRPARAYWMSLTTGTGSIGQERSRLSGAKGASTYWM
jgi:GT2 family glycosyltransferase